MPKGGVKLSDAEFWSLLRENGGLFSRTVRAAKVKYNVDITRQSVEARAKKDLDQLKDIQEQNLDDAEEDMVIFRRSENIPAHVRYRATLDYLRAKGKHRGWGSDVVLIGGTLDNLEADEFRDQFFLGSRDEEIIDMESKFLDSGEEEFDQ